RKVNAVCVDAGAGKVLEPVAPDGTVDEIPMHEQHRMRPSAAARRGVERGQVTDLDGLHQTPNSQGRTIALIMHAYASACDGSVLEARARLRRRVLLAGSSRARALSALAFTAAT